ncbi:NUDIX domain-containing protein [uncultured Clostridium sp.]|uniref:NUDIX hydrolase n=1 Tax=uncultured Clostridium sp. TaxID=59620 RepID=UPI0026150E85|nr:NUDIX domain-containing protein [uncultured Clostridium sp.]
METKRKNKKGQTLEEFLESYKPGNYEKPSLTVDMLLFTVVDKFNENKKKVPSKELKIMLVKRKNHPFIGQWAIPGGFVDINESVEEAVYRELKEETNIENVYLEQLYLFGDVDRDPRMRVVSSSYMALVSHRNLNPIAGDDAEDVMWFTVQIENEEEGKQLLILQGDDEKTVLSYTIKTVFEEKGILNRKKIIINPVYEDLDTQIAFDHIKIINMALERMRNKIEYTPIAFTLVDEYFTLTELQKVYEVILGKELRKSNFRKKIASMVIETEKKWNEGGYRPPKLYKFNREWTHEF